MQPNTLELAKSIYAGAWLLNQVLVIISVFVWLAATYILYRLTQLRFLLLLIAGDVVFLIARFLDAQPVKDYFFTIPTDYLYCLVPVRELLYLFGTILSLWGMSKGLRYLQTKWTERQFSQPAGGGYSPAEAAGECLTGNVR